MKTKRVLVASYPIVLFDATPAPDTSSLLLLFVGDFWLIDSQMNLFINKNNKNYLIPDINLLRRVASKMITSLNFTFSLE